MQLLDGVVGGVWCGEGWTLAGRMKDTHCIQLCFFMLGYSFQDPIDMLR